MAIKKNETVRSKNGDLFVVMKENKELALGLIARGNNRSIKLGYFFPIEMRSQLDTIKPQKEDAIYITKFGYLHLRDASWPTIGNLADFNHEHWPMPKFGTMPFGTKWVQITEYDEEKLESTISILNANNLPKGYDIKFIIRDSLAGAGFVEDVLESIQNGERKCEKYFP